MRVQGEPPVKGRAGGWTPGKMRRTRARRGGFEARRSVGRARGRRLSVGAGAQSSTRGAQPGPRGRRRVGGDRVKGRTGGEEQGELGAGGGEEEGRG